MKHGPNALLEKGRPVIVLATSDKSDGNSQLRYRKTMANILEVNARDGQVIAIAGDGDEEVGEEVQNVRYVPAARELLLPLLEIVPLQLLCGALQPGSHAEIL
jgi:glucosamine--fructose-6-phosphate aminotransferase (isomerizing)